MALRTAAQYIESLRDGRTVYYRGQRVDDVTTHSLMKVAVEHAAIDFDLAEDPEHADLAVAADAENGEPISRMYHVPQSSDDLVKRSDLIDLATRTGATMVTLIKEIGTDALFALRNVAAEMDDALGTEYLERVKAFHRHCARNDLAVAVAQTDSKGDRSKRPSEQEHPDHYVRIVERRSDGIVVRGAKVHTSVSVNSNELIVLPTRNFDERDAEYAVAFATPMNTPGLKLITAVYTGDHDDTFQFPMGSKHRMLETLTVFDDVIVPWERVFLAGEHQYAGSLALRFVDYHRFTAVSYKQPLLDLLVGSAILMSDYNGIARAGHVRDKVTWLGADAQGVKGLLRMAAYHCDEIAPGQAVPNRLYSNVAKWQFAHGYHEALQHVQDITGGLLVTAPGREDLDNPETRAYVERYLGGRAGISAEDRLKAIHMIAELTTGEFGGYHTVLAIHAEGSLEAEKLAIYRAYDAKTAVAYALKVAGIR